MTEFDVIIIGGGIAGLYCAYQLKKFTNKSFVVLEKNSYDRIGGRIYTTNFYGNNVAFGAGIGRKNKDHLLIEMMNELEVQYTEQIIKKQYAKYISIVDTMDIVNKLKYEYNKNPILYNTMTFKQFFTQLFGGTLYDKFRICNGYTDFENADVYDTLYNYGFDDNTDELIALMINWNDLIQKLLDKIGTNNIIIDTEVTHIDYNDSYNNKIVINTKNNTFVSSKVIIAVTIDAVLKLLPTSTIYNNIQGQPFFRVYGKFNDKSIETMKKYVQMQTIVKYVNHKIIPINPNDGIYMIAYTDNTHANMLKPYIDNNEQNINFWQELIRSSLNIVEEIFIDDILGIFWHTGTHYYKPINNKYQNRNVFIYNAQHPLKNIIVVGEMISNNQGWCQGALESVQTVINDIFEL